MNEKIPPAGGQLPLRVLRKAVLLLAIVTVFAGLFGCSARPEPPAGELTVVSAAGGRMSRTESYSFSFSAIRKDGVWMFSTRCYADREDGYAVVDSTTWKEEDGRFYYDTGITGEVMGEPTDPFMAIDVTEDGCLLYQMGMILLERA